MRGHICRRGKSWCVSIYLGMDPQTNRKRRKWYTHRTLREAQAHLTQILAQVQAGAGAPPTRLLLGDLLETWLRDDVAGRLQPTTEEIYTHAVRHYLTPALGAMPCSRLSAPAIQGCMNGLLAKGLSPATVHQAYRTLRTALGVAVRWGLLLRNPCTHARPPHVPTRQGTVWDSEQVRLFLAEARRSSPHYAMYLTLLLGGLRPGEALALRWKDVNLAVGTIEVHQKLYRLKDKQVWGETKTHRRHAVSIPLPLAEDLRAHRARRPVAGREALVFAQLDGKPLHARNISQRDFRRVTKRAGLPRIRLYDLRHCAATLLADQGTPVHIVQHRLGHSSPTTTLRYYTHVLPDAERAAAENLAARLLDGVLDPGVSRG